MSNAKLITAAEKAYDSADSLIDAVMAIVAIVPTFPEKVTEQDEADIRAGLLNRAKAKFPTRFFLREGDTYTMVTSADAKKADASKVLSFNADTVMRTTPHELGQMKTSEPGRHKVVAAMRKAVQTNASNRYTYIETIARRERGITGVARVPGELITRSMKALAGIDKMHATARSKGVPAAWPQEAIKAAEAAYLAKIETYTKK
jgi:hypothetical protein